MFSTAPPIGPTTAAIPNGAGNQGSTPARTEAPGGG